MSQAGPILFVSNAERPAFIAALDEARLFPVVDSDWASAARAVSEVQPAAVLAAMSGGHEPYMALLARKIADQPLYLPLVALDAQASLPHNALPFATRGNAAARRETPARVAAVIASTWAGFSLSALVSTIW